MLPQEAGRCDLPEGIYPRAWLSRKHRLVPTPVQVSQNFWGWRCGDRRAEINVIIHLCWGTTRHPSFSSPFCRIAEAQSNTWHIETPINIYWMKGRMSDVPGEQGTPAPCILSRVNLGLSQVLGWSPPLPRPWPAGRLVRGLACGAAVGRDSHSLRGAVSDRSLSGFKMQVFCFVLFAMRTDYRMAESK